MNKKLILAVVAAMLSVSAANATNVTGATGGNGVYSVAPEKFSGIAGYRIYDNFSVSKGDVLNMEFVRPGEGKTQPTAFVNLIGKNGVNINGLVNTTRNGNFYNGHAIFITPGGFVVGQSGVLNVGRLSVGTPTDKTYNGLVEKYNANEVQSIGAQVSQLSQNSKGNAGANDIRIQGKVFARNGVEMTGKNVNVSGSIVNGILTKNADFDKVITKEEVADQMFKSLVNTNGLLKPAEDLKFSKSSNRILIKSTNGMNISGNVNNSGDVYLTNNGSEGLVVSGKAGSTSLVRLYNTAGNLELRNEAALKSNDKVVIQNKGADLTLGSKSSVLAHTSVDVINDGTGRLTAAGNITTQKIGTSEEAPHISILNRKGSGLTVNGDIKNVDRKGEIAIHNYSGDLLVNGNVSNNGNMGIINEGSGAVIGKNAVIENTGKLKIANIGDDGLTFVGSVKNDGEVRIYNDGGKLKFTTDSTGEKAASIENKNGKLYIISRKNGTGIEQSTSSVITNENGNLVIRNSGTKTEAGTRGTDLQGKIAVNNGTLSINNDFGDMYVSSDIQVNNGDLGIINRENGGDMTLGSTGKINISGGNANIKNYGTGDMTVNSEISHNGRVNVIANSGKLNLGSTVHNNSGALSDNGGFYAASRVNGKGINVTSAFAVDGNGEVLIKNISGEEGLRYNGTINTTGHQAALVNHKGNMDVYGSITTKDAPVIISNKGAGIVIYNSAVLNSGTEGTLVNTGTEAGLIGKNAQINNMKQYEKIKK